MTNRTSLLLFALPILAACSRAPEPEPKKSGPSDASTSTIATSARPAAPAARGAAGAELAWDAPASFTKVDHPSTMRKATYNPPKVGSDTEAPELAVTVVGGSIDANIERWVGQFDPAAKETLTRSAKKVGSYDVTLVEMRGTFAGGGMMGGAPSQPKPGWALLAVIVPVGDSSWFFKMTGPEASMSAAKADFDAMVASFRPGG